MFNKFLLYIPAFFIIFTNVALCADGITDTTITLGQSCALSGPAKALGAGMNIGMSAYFSKINAKGGIFGRKIILISRDDGYEPKRAIKNTHELIQKNKVFILIGEVGTPTSQAVVPISERAGVPFFGAFTGADFLRSTAQNSFIVNVRGSYNQEMERIAGYLVDKKKFTRIACFYQNDGYGQAGLKSIIKALKKRNIDIIARGFYERNTMAVKSALLAIRKGTPDAVVMIGSYKPCAVFIKLAKKFGMENAVFCNISFVGTNALINELGMAGEGVIISQVVNFPWDRSLPIVDEYTKDMENSDKKDLIGFVSLEGYIAAKLFCMAAETVGNNLTRKNFLEALYKIKNFNLGGLTLTYGETDNQGMDQVFLTIIKDGSIYPFEED
ncbi:branched-chain amino acid transport system substrate-binding protein [Candidatus Magnetomoraceae bacterium gMMP-15]